MTLRTRNQARLIKIGEALFMGTYAGSPSWQNGVARLLGVNSKQVHRWLTTDSEPSDERIEQLRAVGRERIKRIEEAIG